MNFLERIKLLIEQEGITEKELTSRLGIANSTFTDWRKKTKGNYSMETVVKIADYFNVSLDWLVRGDQKYAPQIKMRGSELELLNKFKSLPSESQASAIAYIDGILSTLNPPCEKEERLLG